MNTVNSILGAVHQFLKAGGYDAHLNITATRNKPCYSGVPNVSIRNVGLPNLAVRVHDEALKLYSNNSLVAALELNDPDLFDKLTDVVKTTAHVP